MVNHRGTGKPHQKLAPHTPKTNNKNQSHQVGGTTNQRGTICYNQKQGGVTYRGRQVTPADVPSGEKAPQSFVTCDHATPTHLPRVGNWYPGPCKQSTSRHRLAGPPQNCYHKAAGNQNAVAKPETTVSASNALKNWLLQFPTSPDL